MDQHTLDDIQDLNQPDGRAAVDISLVTSLYRAEAHLPGYIERAGALVHQVVSAGLSLELIIIANDPTGAEEQHIRRLKSLVQARESAAVVAIKVPRESVYASWNRGFRLARGRCVGPWNVDDIRSAAALIEGQQLIAGGETLVYFPYTVVQHVRLLNMVRLSRRVYYKAPPFDRALFIRAMRGASFWLCLRDLYDRVGAFDDNFRISGDFEWFRRALMHTEFHPGQQHAGEFHLHGGNLSDTGNPLQTVENNIVHLRHHDWELVAPAQPDLMRTCWEQWGSQGATLPDEIQDRLWGPDAFPRWRAWVRQQNRKRYRTMLSERLRAIPRFIIDHTHLRPTFARWGLVKSASKPQDR